MSQSMVETISWRRDLREAYEIATQTDRLVFIDWADLPRCLGCKSLDATTYIDPEVARFIHSHFVPVQIHQDESSDLFREHEIVWTPTLCVETSNGEEVSRMVGYLPASDLLAWFDLVRAHQALKGRDYQGAEEILDERVSEAEDSALRPELLYWKGVVEYKLDRSYDRLAESWDQIVSDYPKSEWARKADVFG